MMRAAERETSSPEEDQVQATLMLLRFPSETVVATTAAKDNPR